MEKIVSDIGRDLLGEVYRFEVKRRGTRAQQIAPRYTQELHFNAQAVKLFYNLLPVGWVYKSVVREDIKITLATERVHWLAYPKEIMLL